MFDVVFMVAQCPLHSVLSTQYPLPSEQTRAGVVSVSASVGGKAGGWFLVLVAGPSPHQTRHHGRGGEAEERSQERRLPAHSGGVRRYQLSCVVSS